VHDAPPRVADAEVGDAALLRALGEALHLRADLRLVGQRPARLGLDVVVRGRHARVGPPQRQPLALEASPRGARPLVEQVAVDVEQVPAPGAFDDHVAAPDLLEHRERRHRHAPRGW
jgi:hypothetical protein